MSTAKGMLTVAAVLVVVPLAWREGGTVAPRATTDGDSRSAVGSAMRATMAQGDERQATPAEVRAFLRGVSGANGLQCELIIQSFDSWSSFRAPDGDSTARAMTMVPRRGIASAEVVPDLMAAMRAGDWCTARLAARMLGRSQLPQARAELVTALRDSAVQVRQLAAIGLGFTSDTTTSPQLVRALGDRDERVRAAAAWALGAVR